MSRPQGRLAALGALLLLSTSVFAQQRAFTTRYTTDVAGDLLVIGNTLMTAPAGAAGDAARNGTASPIDNNNNNNHTMGYVDIDGDPSTFNSSSATLSLPSGAGVLFAGLYWGAYDTAGTGGVAPPSPAQRTSIRFATPASGYTTLISTVNDSSGSGYSCFFNVTASVQAAGNGVYTVANLQAGTGANRFGGWGLVVVYSDPTQPPRNLSVFDGHQLVDSGATSVNINISGFRTPASGAVRTHIGAVTMEGDLGFTGDNMRLNGTPIPAPADPMNPSTNIFNSTITRLGTRISAKTPDYINQMGWDVDDFNANGVLANNATNATINVTTSSETYAPIAIAFATELYAPQISAPKSVVDLNGNDINPGDELEYTIAISNAGGDSAGQAVLNDPIPANTTYVPGSLQISTGANAGAKTDAAGDDQGEFIAGSNRIIVRLGTGANATQGGVIAIGDTTAVKFRVRVNANTPNGTQIFNQSSLSYTSLATGTAIADASTASAVNVLYEAIGRVFLDNGAGGGTANDGIFNGGEGGLAGAVVRLTNSAGTTVYDTVTTDATGLYRLNIPLAIPIGTQLRITETNPPGFFSSGGSPGTTGGSYSAATDTVTFTLGNGSPVDGAAYGDINFGDASNSFAPDGQKSGLPGTIVIYPHTFTAGGSGTVTFSTASVSNPAMAGWTQTIHRDLDGDGVLDADDPQVTAPIAVAAGQRVHILVKEFIPLTAPLSAVNRVTVTAAFAGATNASYTRTDTTTVGTETSPAFTLQKAVDKPSARPGESITYTIAYRNESTEPLTDIVVHDTTPAFSTFTSATNGPLPASLTGVTLNAPAAGASGAIRWTFTGTLVPGGNGTVSFTVTLDQ